MHIGMLYGRRWSEPSGLTGPFVEADQQKNHVVEVDLGMPIKKAHSVQLVIARSSNVVDGAVSEGDQPPASWQQISSSSGIDNVAALVRWGSTFSKARMKIGFEARLTGPEFISLGMGYVRQGSRSAAIDVERSLGDRIRVRSRYVYERREQLTTMGSSAVNIQRLQVQGTCRLTDRLIIHGSLMPLRSEMASPEGSVVQQDNLMLSAGWTWRYSIKRTSGGFTGDLVRYSLQTSSGSTIAYNASVSTQATFSERVSCSLRANTLVDPSGPDPPVDLSTLIGYHGTRGLQAELAWTLPVTGSQAASYSLTLSRSVCENIMLGVSGGSVSRSDLFLNNEEFRTSDDYTWTAFVQARW